MISVFYFYSQRDEHFRDQLETQLAVLGRQGIVGTWHGRKVEADGEADEVSTDLAEAHIVLLLVSPDFLASKCCYDIEIRRALARHKRGDARVIPVILRNCLWQTAPFGKLQGVPDKPLSVHSDQDEAFTYVVAAILEAAGDVLKASGSRGSASPPVRRNSRSRVAGGKGRSRAKTGPTDPTQARDGVPVSNEDTTRSRVDTAKAGRETRIFISYRRADSAYPADSIYKAMAFRFGKDAVVFDVDTIPPGENFRVRLYKEVSQCNVLLAVIGDNWLDARNERGQRRLDDPDDFVRVEIEAAMSRGIRVIPVLVGWATMPNAVQLPKALANLSDQNATEVRPGRDLDSHLERLVRDVERALAETPVKDMIFHALAAARGKNLRRTIQNKKSPPS